MKEWDIYSEDGPKKGGMTLDISTLTRMAAVLVSAWGAGGLLGSLLFGYPPDRGAGAAGCAGSVLAFVLSAKGGRE